MWKQIYLLLGVDSDVSDVMSEDEAAPPPMVNQTAKHAVIDPNSSEFSSNIAKDNLKVHVVALRNESLNKLNPILLAKAIDAVNGPVEKVSYIKSGTISITCTSPRHA